MLNKKKSLVPNPMNQERMLHLITVLIELEYEVLASILLELIESSPNYAAQIQTPHEFLNSLSEILDGLSFNYLEKYINNSDEFSKAKQIATQATIVKRALFISGNFVTVAKAAKGLSA